MEETTYNAMDFIPEDALDILTPEPAENENALMQPRSHGEEDAIPGMNTDEGRITDDETGE